MDWSKLKTLTEESNRIILSTHRDPDGDGLGSEMGMYYYLKSIGKNVEVINISETPSRYEFLDPKDIIKPYSIDIDNIISNANLLIVFDLGDFSRTGRIGEIIDKNNIATVNIDHHVAKDAYDYSLSIVNDKAPSTTFMIWKYFEYLGLNDKPLSDSISLSLYAGLVNDTGSFRYESVTSEAHDMASHMLQSNINPNTVFSNIYENSRISKIRLLSSMIDQIQFEEDNKVGYVVLETSTLTDTGSTISDTEGFSEFIRAIDGIEISFSVIKREGFYKLSFRSDGKYTVNDIAGIFGGGGHRFAAGCSIDPEKLDDAIRTILDECKRKINNGN